MESIWGQKLYAWEVRSQRSTLAAAASWSAGDAQRLPAAPWSAPMRTGRLSLPQLDSMVNSSLRAPPRLLVRAHISTTNSPCRRLPRRPCASAFVDLDLRWDECGPEDG